MSIFIGKCSFNNDLKFDYKSEENNTLSIKYNENKYTILLNGRIYNKGEIKDELYDLGFKFESNSDKEILLKGYIQFGKDVLKKLNGVFSFAIWNNNKKELFIARDQFGIKPIYYTLLDKTIIFSTEIKDILKCKGVETVIDKIGVLELLGIRTSTFSRTNTI